MIIIKFYLVWLLVRASFPLVLWEKIFLFCFLAGKQGWGSPFLFSVLFVFLLLSLWWGEAVAVSFACLCGLDLKVLIVYSLVIYMDQWLLVFWMEEW